MNKNNIALLNKLKEFRKLVIIAIFSNDELGSIFSLKGGSALDLVYNITYRTSIDVDIAMKDDIPDENFDRIKNLLNSTLQETFNENEPPYSIFDFKFEKRPFKIEKDKKHFWGGYKVEFKIRKGLYPYIETQNSQKASREAEVIDFSQGKKFEIDISKFEFITPSKLEQLDDYTIRVYSLEMIIYEKLRAICQKLPNYNYAHKTITPRPKDFYDIFMIMKNQSHLIFENLDLSLLEKIFEQKDVPLTLLFEIKNFKKEVFDEGVPQLNATFINSELDEFDADTIFNFIINGINKIPNIITIKN